MLLLRVDVVHRIKGEGLCRAIALLRVGDEDLSEQITRCSTMMLLAGNFLWADPKYPSHDSSVWQSEHERRVTE